MTEDFDPDKLAEEAMRSATGAEIERLLKLSRLDYQRARKDAAAALGISVAALDAEIKERRKENKSDSAELPHWVVEPWAHSVPTADLLDEVSGVFKQYVFLPQHGAEAIALWTLHTWVFDSFDVSPFLLLRSPTRRCGKTTVLTLLKWTTRRSELASSTSASAIFRHTEVAHPTWLVDEGEAFIKGNEEMRGILNSGHTRAAASVLRTVEEGGEHVTRRFSTWSPKAIASIGELADTLHDRGITLLMQRKAKDLKFSRLRDRDTEDFAKLRQKLLRWADDNAEHFLKAEPALPEALNDRAVDNWEPLLAIADLAGEEWGRKARFAALALSGDDVGEDDGTGVQLLRDVRAIFADKEELFTEDLIEALVADAERPWGTYNYKNGKPITSRQIGGLLKPFHVISVNLGTKGTRAKGYRKHDFAEAWERYLPIRTHGDVILPYIGTSPTAAGTSDVFSSVHQGPVYGGEKGKKPNNDGPKYGCTDKKHPGGAEEESPPRGMRPVPHRRRNRPVGSCRPA